MTLYRGGTTWVGDRLQTEPADELVMPGLDEEPLVRRDEVKPPGFNLLVHWWNGDNVVVALEQPSGEGFDPPVVLLAVRHGGDEEG